MIRRTCYWPHGKRGRITTRTEGARAPCAAPDTVCGTLSTSSVVAEGSEVGTGMLLKRARSCRKAKTVLRCGGG